PIDPVEAARRAMRPRLPRRFYTAVGVEAVAEGFAVVLDSRAARTPARQRLAAPVRPLALAIAAEWGAQGTALDPAAMPVTRIANSIIDGVAPTPERVAGDVAKYLASDLLFYRAETPAALVARQAQHWDPILNWAQATLDARFMCTTGVIHL